MSKKKSEAVGTVTIYHKTGVLYGNQQVGPQPDQGIEVEEAIAIELELEPYWSRTPFVGGPEVVKDA